MQTNILEQDFSNFAKKIEKQGVDTLLDYYIQRVSDNETALVTQYATKLLNNKEAHTPDPRIYMRQNLLSLVQDSYALGIVDGYKSLESVQMSYRKTIADFAIDPNDKLQRDIDKLQRDILASQQIVRQAKTLDAYTNTLQSLQTQAQALNNTQATQTLNQLTQQLNAIKTGNTVRGVTKLVNQQSAQNTVQQQTLLNGSPNTEDYLIKRAIEEKLKYLQNRKDALAETPPIILDEDKEFFRWYSQKRIVPIANRYQQGIANKNEEVKAMVADYTEKINKGTISDAAKGSYQQRIINKILNIENNIVDKGKPIKRVQRVVATELAIAYNVGRLKTYLKAGIQYVTISTYMYENTPCSYCLDSEEKSLREPIKISSLLKNAYRNDGFKNKTAYEAGRNVPIEQRYLVSHPYCMCVYVPHPQMDEVEEPDSQGVYDDPSSLKFIVGAGLGVSLVFLAFALTTGKKIAVPETIPALVPRVALPVTSRDNAPDTIPIDMNIPIPDTTNVIAGDLRNPLDLRLRVLFDDFQIAAETLPLTRVQKAILDRDLIDIFRGGDKELIDVISKGEELLARIQTPEYAKSIVDIIAKKAGVTKELYFRRFDKIAENYNNRVPIQKGIDKLQARTQQYLSKVNGESLIRATNNIEKKDIDGQLKPIAILRADLQASLGRVSAKVNKKEADIEYIKDLQFRINDLDNFATILEQQKLELENIRTSVNIIDKTVINQQIAVTQSLVDRLTTDLSLLPEVEAQYEDLSNMIATASVKDAPKYKKIQTELNRKIKSAQGIELKRFTGNMSNFSVLASYKYS